LSPFERTILIRSHTIFVFYIKLWINLSTGKHSLNPTLRRWCIYCLAIFTSKLIGNESNRQYLPSETETCFYVYFLQEEKGWKLLLGSSHSFINWHSFLSNSVEVHWIISYNVETTFSLSAQALVSINLQTMYSVSSKRYYTCYSWLLSVLLTYHQFLWSSRILKALTLKLSTNIQSGSYSRL